jgi:D-alanyl-D-alanine carboxypeptidase/D-alanyl-D-alanine-endopeptidase (penicillin-binding protein 4)
MARPTSALLRVTCLFICAVLPLGCRTHSPQSATGPTNLSTSSPQASVEATQPTTRPTESAGASTRPSTRPTLLQQQLDAALPFQQATVAARVIELPSGRELYAKSADLPVMPASNMKLFTTAAAVSSLPAPFVTHLAHKGDDLYLVGWGDPALGDPTIAGWKNKKPTADFEPFAKALRDKGLTRIKGNLYYDDWAFDDQRTSPTWSKSFRQFWYAAPVSGLNFNDNCIDVTVHPTEPGQPVRVEVMPETSRIKIVNHCFTAADKHNPQLDRAADDDYAYVLTGPCKSTTVLPSKPVHDPGHFTADALRTYLATQRINIEGEIRRTQGKLKLEAPLTSTDPGKLTNGAIVIAQHISTMDEVLKRTNKNSQNMFAEALAKQLGVAGGDARGSWSTGQERIRAFLTRRRIDPAAFVAADGSGLSRENRVTAHMVTELLAAMHPAQAYAIDEEKARLWYDSLAQPGQPGTLRIRLRDLAGKMRGKTGSIGGVRALSGYLTTADKKTLVFSFILNDIKGDEAPAVARVDNAVRILANP